MAPATLRRSLSLWHVTLSGIGVILGAGVYALIGPAAAQAGNGLWLAFLLAGLTAGLTAYAYARLARLAPRNSPEFQYTARALLCRWPLLHAGMASIVAALGAVR